MQPVWAVVLCSLLSSGVQSVDSSVFACSSEQPCEKVNLMQLRHAAERQHKPIPIAGKSIYFILVDRFARDSGNNTECGFTDGFQDNNWCNGTINGIIEQLDYIQGMGFEGIWITPIVEQRPGRDGQSGYGSHGYWAWNLYEVDPHFGTQEDVQELANKLHDRGMFFILDIVANHMGPIHSAAEVAMIYPFNETKYYHQLDIGDMTFDQYTEKVSGWPPPTQCQGPGALCAKDSRADCGCYSPACGGAFQPPCTPGTLVFNTSSGCPTDFVDSMCRPGAFACPGYNETVIHEGWFFDLGDLNQSDPFVFEEQLKWVKWLKNTFKLDGIRLDTAPYMTLDFLSALQTSAKVPILGETTATNMSFHASFQVNPPPSGTPVLQGVLNFPLTYVADAAFCGNWFPYSTLNLTTLAQRTKEQLHGGFYKDLDLLGNFMDNHDMDRLAKICSDGSKPATSRIFNSLAWNFFAKGMPIMYYGTEVFMTEQRGSFWQYGFKTDTSGYKFVKLLNMVRKQQDLALKDMEVVTTANNMAGQLVLSRGGLQGTYAFLNNLGPEASASEVDYCLWSFPAADVGNAWVDALSGRPANIDQSCLRTRGSMPAIVYQMPLCDTQAMNPSYGFYYDIECNERSLPGCRADGQHDVCRYCGAGSLGPCP